ncbi:MAG: anti-sigma factor domain-containing protein [Syntrophomonadaceae bacterium]|nr:anti-sigma factor domain-containing protein [Syntrophomonadaceae bacterium]MDH7497633.1 anti-sigma factor domain-containing protein [Syntrophomonadaceae bacterium]
MAVIRGIVVQADGREAVVLTRSGEFKRIRTRRPVLPGAEIEERVWTADLLSATAAVLVLFMLTWGIIDFFTVCAYASVEAMPGVELGINRWQVVVTATALNDEGAQLLANLSLRGRGAGTAVRTVIQEAVAQGTEIDQVIIAVVPVTGAGRGLQSGIMTQLQAAAEQALHAEGNWGAAVRAVKATAEERERARENRQGVGSYHLQHSVPAGKSVGQGRLPGSPPGQAGRVQGEPPGGKSPAGPPAPDNGSGAAPSPPSGTSNAAGQQPAAALSGQAGTRSATGAGQGGQDVLAPGKTHRVQPQKKAAGRGRGE